MNKIRLGMIGGGSGSFIGAVHRKAAALDGHYELVCGAFSSQAANSAATGAELGLEANRTYNSYQEMLQREAQLPVSERVQAISIVTPNHLHAQPAIEALQHGFHVILDKPLAMNLTEARQIATVMQDTGQLLALTHTYAGYPMLMEARHRVVNGQLGKIRKVYVEYTQGWLSSALEKSGQKQAAWRTNPDMAGSGAIGDIGTHAAHLAEYISNQRITHLCASVSTFVPGRQIDDDSAALLRFENDASGVLIATQVAAGEENRLTVRLYGERGGLEWSHESPDSLVIKLSNEPITTYRAGTAGLSAAAAAATRLPSGHPEGFIEAFANIYSAFAQAVRQHSEGLDVSISYPSIEEGLRGMAFIEAMKTSSNSNEKWTAIRL